MCAGLGRYIDYRGRSPLVRLSEAVIQWGIRIVRMRVCLLWGSEFSVSRVSGVPDWFRCRRCFPSRRVVSRGTGRCWWEEVVKGSEWGSYHVLSTEERSEVDSKSREACSELIRDGGRHMHVVRFKDVPKIV